MATSGSIDFTLTARQVINEATRANMYRDGQEQLSDADNDTAMLHLNLMLKSWQADGCNLWRETEDSIVFTAGTARQNLDPRVIDVMEARLQVSSTYERMLNRWEWGQYVQMPNKTTPGDPVVFVIRRQRTKTEMLLWPVPSENRTILYTAARVIQDVDSLDHELDLPQEWLEAAIYGLAARLCEPLGVTVSNPNVVARVQERADMLYSNMRDMDRPSSVTMNWQR